MNRNYYQALISLSMQHTDATGTVSFVIYGSSFSVITRGIGIISWGDGTQSSVSGSSDTTTSHTYANAGTYTLVFAGSITKVAQVNTTQAAKVRNVLSYSLPSLTTAFKAFSDCSNAEFDAGFTFGSSITSFSNCFKGCVGLTLCPQFPANSSTNNLSFASCFQGCTGITTAAVLPSVVSNSNKNANFSNMYNGCTGLLTLSSSHRRISPNGKDMSYMFKGCSRLVADISKIVGDYETTGITTAKSIDAIQAFYGCSNLTGSAPKWWNSATRFNSYSKCFYGCTGLSNYTSIPAGWRTS